MAKVQLNGLIEQMEGRLGDLRIRKTKHGTVVREKPRYKRFSSDRQQEAQLRFTLVTEAWAALTRSEYSAWVAYAEGKPQSGYNLFLTLGLKIVQISALAPIPTLPPTETFTSDSVQMTLSVSPGELTLHASHANAPGVVTELLLQRLPNPRRAVTGNYVSMAFVAFAPGALAHSLPVEPGWWVVAYRFVDAATGQMGQLTRFEAVEV